MSFLRGAAAAGALTIALTATGTGLADTGTNVVALAGARNHGLREYTFHVNVGMKMKHFPWLSFHMEGLGSYQRGKHYKIHFTNKPFFASKMPDIDLSMIDPSMWPHRYRYIEEGTQDGDTVYALEPLHDPSIKSASVAVNPLSGTHWADATYSDGTHIRMNVSSNEVGDFLLPASMSADVDYPRMPLSASADFQDYAFGTR